MNELYIFVTLIASTIFNTNASDLLGCGGFIKSRVPIDSSKVEVRLYTKQGILKDKTNCAPNGYYFLPLYEKGEYVLKLEPPAGWSFNPTKVNLNVDGETDLCSQSKDINFAFEGFGITGKVESLGTSNIGPANVEVTLKFGENLRKTVTGEGGNFFFTPVDPGKYTVLISHPKWKIFKNAVDVVVKEGNTELPPKSLVIQGYDVRGAIKSDGEAVKDATVILFQKGNIANVLVSGCLTDPLPNVKFDNKPICHVKSNENGVFVFEAVPNGDYYLLPYYKEQNIYFKPEKIEFSMEHNSLEITENFEIVGFSISGSVLKSENGIPIPNADIYLDGKLITKSNSNGGYKLEKLKVGTYQLRAEADGYKFKEVSTKINPSSKKMPDLIPTAFRVCGKVISDQPQTITFDKIGSTQLISTTSNSNNGSFCEFLSSGKYETQVVIDSTNKQKGMQFFPIKQTVEVNFNTVSNIVFSQLKATITGKVQCIQNKDCLGLNVIIAPSDSDSDSRISFTLKENCVYKFENIYPGNYEILLGSNKFCWRSLKQIINVNSDTIEVPPFVQQGYEVNFVSSHKTQVTFKGHNNRIESLEIAKGRSKHCLEKQGEFNFKLDSCHSYESGTLSYNTDSTKNEITLNAIKHLVTLSIKSEKNHGRIQVSVKIGNEKSIQESSYNSGNYLVKLNLSPSENAVIVPLSDKLYFTPPVLSIGGDDDCADLGVKFTAVEGRVFQGKVVPPLANVIITVDSENTDRLTAETDSNGFYKFPPLDDSKQYKISAKKDAYVLIGPDNDGTFFAHKLAEIIVEVVAETDSSPLQGALLSLSGGESYRSNLQTNENGKITFSSLSPNEYFLRPMMKEYKFDPTSKSISVKEGQSVNVKLIGKRVAYSAFGQVTSLNGLPEDNLIVQASGIKNCSHFSEESTTESNGQFRIRGLHPYCSYVTRIKGHKDDKQIIERSAPASIHLDIVNEDVADLKMVIFRPITSMDILVKVFAENPDHYKNLKIKVSRESAPSGLIQLSKVDLLSSKITSSNNKGILFQTLSIPMDNKSYSVQLESNIPQSSKWKPDVAYITANTSFKYVELNFVVKTNVTEQHIKQTSIWTLVIIFSIIAILYNIEFVAGIMKDKFNFNITGILNLLPTFGNRKTNDYYDFAEIDQIVQSINNVKRKPKSKKA